MLRTLIYLAFGGLIALVAVGAGVAYWTADSALTNALRGQRADKTLDGYADLAVLLERYERALSRTVIRRPASFEPADALRKSIDASMQNLHASIAAETAEELLVPGSLEAEFNELAVLARIRAQLEEIDTTVARARSAGADSELAFLQMQDLVHQRYSADVRPGIDKLILDEREQVERAEQRSNDILDRFRIAAILYAFIATALVVFIGYYFSRRIRIPFDALLSGTRVMAMGDLERRIIVPYADEFAAIANQINEVAIERKESRERLVAQREQLERTVAARTDELQAAMEQVKAADKLRRHLFDDISHELRTPLTVMRGEAEIALRGPEKSAAELRETLERIIPIARQLARLIDDLLFISRTEHGTHRMTMTVVPLQALLASVCQNGRALAFERTADAQIELSTPPEGVSVSGDPDRLHQLFVILMDNAIRYSAGTVRIAMSLSVKGSLAIVSVTDRGCGISEAELPSLFLRYQRGRNPVGHGANGMGLGLPITKAIVDAHGGHIEVESTRGVGTTVRVTFEVASTIMRDA